MGLQPADILLINSSKLFGTTIDVITDSPWCHAAMITDPAKRLGIEARPISKVGFHSIDEYKGDALVMRYPNLTPDQQQKILQYAKEQVGKEYDYSAIFDELLRYGFGISVKRAANHERFICSTLVTSAYLAAGIRLTDQPLASPDDLFLSNKVTVVGRLGVDI